MIQNHLGYHYPTGHCEEEAYQDAWDDYQHPMESGLTALPEAGYHVLQYLFLGTSSIAGHPVREGMRAPTVFG